MLVQMNKKVVVVIEVIMVKIWLGIKQFKIIEYLMMIIDMIMVVVGICFLESLVIWCMFGCGELEVSFVSICLVVYNDELQVEVVVVIMMKFIMEVVF